MVATLEVNNVYKQFLDKDKIKTHEVLSGINFKTRAGEFISLIGPSGCGKTTLLRIVHGLETVTSGTVVYDGRPVVRPEHSRAFVFAGSKSSTLTKSPVGCSSASASLVRLRWTLISF